MKNLPIVIKTETKGHHAAVVDFMIQKGWNHNTAMQETSYEPDRYIHFKDNFFSFSVFMGNEKEFNVLTFEQFSLITGIEIKKPESVDVKLNYGVIANITPSKNKRKFNVEFNIPIVLLGSDNINAFIEAAKVWEEE